MRLWDKIIDTPSPPGDIVYADGLFAAVTAGNIATLKWLATEARGKIASSYQGVTRQSFITESLIPALESILKSSKDAAFSDCFARIVNDVCNCQAKVESLWVNLAVVLATSGRFQSESVLMSFWRKQYSKGLSL